MKKAYISLNSIFLISFSIACISCHAEDFFIDSNFDELKNPQVQILQKITNTRKNTKEKTEEKSGFFSKLFKKEKKDDGYQTQKKFNTTTTAAQECIQYAFKNSDFDKKNSKRNLMLLAHEFKID